MVVRKNHINPRGPFGLAKPDSFLRCRALGAFRLHATPLPFAAGANPKMVD
jgi:hypothetical protein